MISSRQNCVFFAFVGDHIHVLMSRKANKCPLPQLFALPIEHNDLLPRSGLFHKFNFTCELHFVIWTLQGLFSTWSGPRS